MKKILLSIFLLAAIVALTWWVFQLFLTPLNFEEQRLEREKAVIERLKDIRTAQRAYRTKYQKFTPNLDELIAFIEKDSLIMERSTGSEDDSLAMAQGLVKKEKYAMAVKDTIFPKSFVATEMCFIPFSDVSTGQLQKFTMDTSSVTTESSVVVPVFEAMAPYTTFLGDLDPQELINFRDYQINTLNRADGLKVGSLQSTTNEAGNWE